MSEKSERVQDKGDLWLSIEGYEGFYEMSVGGSVRSITRVLHGRVYSGKKVKRTKKRVWLLKDGKWRRIRVDRLVRTPAPP